MKMINDGLSLLMTSLFPTLFTNSNTWKFIYKSVSAAIGTFSSGPLHGLQNLVEKFVYVTAYTKSH